MKTTDGIRVLLNAARQEAREVLETSIYNDFSGHIIRAIHTLADQDNWDEYVEYDERCSEGEKHFGIDGPPPAVVDALRSIKEGLENYSPRG